MKIGLCIVAAALNLSAASGADAAEPAGAEIALKPAFPNMDFDGFAIGLYHGRLGASGPLRWFVAERDGDVWTFVDHRASKDGFAADGVTPVEQAELFLDVPEAIFGIGAEGGLLAVAFDPAFGVEDSANFVYAHYTTFPNNNVWRYRVGRVGAAFAILESTKIFSTESGGGNHWGADLKFGPDGYLYLALGDGGNGYPAAFAQRLAWLRGKILRIDPRSVPTGYAIPPDNPFRLSNPGDPQSAPNTPCGGLDRTTLEARTAACPEIYAYGFRNPLRMGFDRANGRLWVGDKGSVKEEIDLVLPGHTYGWNVCDGINPTTTCPPTQTGTTMIAPVAQYRLASQALASVTGGFVYRGSDLNPILQGTYFFSDLHSGEIYVIDTPYANATFAPFAVTNTYEHPAETANPALPRFRVVPNLSRPPLVSFAEDANAELYAITLGDGKGAAVYRLVGGIFKDGFE
jgi:glucose/arabinose dehydrogenase